jgi:16S rRNA (uracil1498-N3)-methyltransferase
MSRTAGRRATGSRSSWFGDRYMSLGIHRFYLDGPLADELIVSLPRDRSQQISKVLRLRVGDEIVLFNGRGGEFPSKLIKVSKDRALALIGPRRAGRPDPSPAIHLVPALLKADRFDWLVQKATELGVAGITPMITERTMVSLQADRAGRKRERWQRVAIEAAEQCGRTSVPLIDEPIPFENVLPRLCNMPALVFWEGEQQTPLWAVAGDEQPLMALVGPEGGFAPREVQAAAEAGAKVASLGPLILRSETAAIVGVAAILTQSTARVSIGT